MISAPSVLIGCLLYPSPQVDEEAQMRCSGPDGRCSEIQCQETAVRPHRTEVATQTYHIQVGVFEFIDNMSINWKNEDTVVFSYIDMHWKALPHTHIHTLTQQLSLSSCEDIRSTRLTQCGPTATEKKLITVHTHTHIHTRTHTGMYTQTGLQDLTSVVDLLIKTHIPFIETKREKACWHFFHAVAPLFLHSVSSFFLLLLPSMAQPI